MRFTAGFGLAAAVPSDLKQAVLLLVADAHAHRGDDSQRVMPPVVLELLNPYRLMRLA